MINWFVGLVAIGLFTGLAMLSLGKEEGIYIASGSVLIAMIGGTLAAVGA